MQLCNRLLEARDNVQHVSADYAVELVAGDVVCRCKIGLYRGMWITRLKVQYVNFRDPRIFAKPRRIVICGKLETIAPDIFGELGKKKLLKVVPGNFLATISPPPKT